MACLASHAWSFQGELRTSASVHFRQSIWAGHYCTGSGHRNRGVPPPGTRSLLVPPLLLVLALMSSFMVCGYVGEAVDTVTPAGLPQEPSPYEVDKPTYASTRSMAFMAHPVDAWWR